MTQKNSGKVCFYCANEPEPGWFETDNNGPIVRCPLCERRASLRMEEKNNDK